MFCVQLLNTKKGWRLGLLVVLGLHCFQSLEPMTCTVKAFLSADKRVNSGKKVISSAKSVIPVIIILKDMILISLALFPIWWQQFDWIDWVPQFFLNKVLLFGVIQCNCKIHYKLKHIPVCLLSVVMWFFLVETQINCDLCFWSWACISRLWKMGMSFLQRGS